MIHKTEEIKNIWEAYALEMDHDFTGMDDNSHHHDHDDDVDVVDVSMDFDTSEPVKPTYEVELGDDDDDFDANMVKSELKKLVEFANRLEEMGNSAKFEPWMTAKLTKAADYISDVYFRLSAKADFANGSEDFNDIEL
jgi:hypothetical protein